MIRLDTFAGLHANQHALAAWCSRCQRWAVIDLSQLIAEGRGGESFIGRRPRCRVCGEAGQYQVRPPTVTGSAVYLPPVSHQGSHAPPI